MFAGKPPCSYKIKKGDQHENVDPLFYILIFEGILKNENVLTGAFESYPFNHPVILILFLFVRSTSCSNSLLLKNTTLPFMGDMF